MLEDGSVFTDPSTLGLRWSRFLDVGSGEVSSFSLRDKDQGLELRDFGVLG